jgi:zinc transporter
VSTDAVEGRPGLFDSPAMVARWPGLIWSYAPAIGGLAAGERPPDCPGLRWLHLNLADQRSQRWIAEESGLPPAFQAFFAAHDIQPQLLIDGGTAGLVLQDLERDFDRSETGRIGALRVAIAPMLIVTGRHHPLLTPDAMRRRLADGAGVHDPTEALDLILSALSDTATARIAEITDRLLGAEDELLADKPPDTRMLIAIRRLSTQLHRITAGIRTTLHRAESEGALPLGLHEVATRNAQRFQLLDAEITATQSQLRLLRDELDLQAAQKTNRILYFLSVVTGIMMPASLVTGYFGMNTSGLPFTEGHHGTFLATTLVFGSAALTYMVLNRVRSGNR